ncbi:MoaD/ThiS family protein [Williamsia sterculiae]|uniref:ThiS family protein n=1 Tax=Williamsia sterculiae TaxID=1344003 RepID=A0A1N7GW91_9NOCA|nr:MoaD/ThiS family protein [Williamsia sterculiae]SIS16800.1 ThiS family protein [Williamsia sterculiae]
MQTIHIRYFAAAAAAAGTDTAVVDLPDDITFAGLEVTLGHANPELARVLPQCSFLRDEVAVRSRAETVAPCLELDVLPPFAGG